MNLVVVCPKLELQLAREISLLWVLLVSYLVQILKEAIAFLNVNYKKVSIGKEQEKETTVAKS